MAFGYPTESQAKLYCQSFRLALYSATGFFIAMHLLTVACYFMFTQNADRDSLVHEEIDFDRIAEDLRAANSKAPIESQNPLNQKVANDNDA